MQECKLQPQTCKLPEDQVDLAKGELKGDVQPALFSLFQPSENKYLEPYTRQQNLLFPGSQI